MKLGLSIGYSGAHLDLPVARVQLAERLGYDSVWTAEAYGSDALTPLAYLAAVTKRIRLGTGIMQLAARTPAAAAMAVGTIDALAGGGRVIAGLGVSGPQIVEGWYGQPWGRPYWRLRDYVGIMRKVFGRKAPVQHEGREISLPYTGPGSAGLAKPLTSILHMRPDIPIWLGTGGESTVKLTAEIADGWLPLGFTPARMKAFRPWLDEGLRRAGGGKTLRDLEIQPRAFVVLTDDVREGLQSLKPRVALAACRTLAQNAEKNVEIASLDNQNVTGFHPYPSRSQKNRANETPRGFRGSNRPKRPMRQPDFAEVGEAREKLAVSRSAQSATRRR
jgi:F420-dependent oxidoreductase-like protein